jgi:Tfp pilus assembly protein PilN
MAAYFVLGGLALAVLAAGAMVLTSNKVKDRRDAIAKLNREQASAQAAASALQPYGSFAQMANDRIATIKSLAHTSFNWERTMRALSRTIPSDAWLTSFKGTVKPGIDVESSAGGGSSVSGLRSKASAPAIELVGCTYSHKAVARMMTRMRDLDGVTEVVLGNSERPTGRQQGSQGAGSGASSSSSGDCRTRYHITKFEILVVLGGLEGGEATAAPQAAAPSPISRAQAAAATVSSQGSPAK